MLKVSTFYLDKQKSFIPKKISSVLILQDTSFFNQQMAYCLASLLSSTTLRYLQISNFGFGTLCAQRNTRERERGVSRILAHNVFDLLTSSTILRLQQQQQLTSHPKVRFLGITSDRIVDSRVFAGNPRDKCRRR